MFSSYKESITVLQKYQIDIISYNKFNNENYYVKTNKYYINISY